MGCDFYTTHDLSIGYKRHGNGGEVYDAVEYISLGRDAHYFSSPSGDRENFTDEECLAVCESQEAKDIEDALRRSREEQPDKVLYEDGEWKIRNQTRIGEYKMMVEQRLQIVHHSATWDDVILLQTVIGVQYR
eukprot:GILJ01025359.1.p1 GENE.GILJ01025359.1~~GILJ01025359.1.p1  ORF type:complete len:133 (+),score=8.90 GILJ01025359.1:375-773(+)